MAARHLHGSGTSGPGNQLPTPAPGVLMPSFNANAPHEKIIAAIINRLKAKLPCNSGIPVSVLEQDEAFNQAVTTLVHLARHRLDHITHVLCQALEKMHDEIQVHEDDLSYYQSQLLLAKILASAMYARWDAYKDEMAMANPTASASDPASPNPTSNSNIETGSSGTNSEVRQPFSPAPLSPIPLSPGTTPRTQAGFGVQQDASSPPTPTTSTQSPAPTQAQGHWIDPPPLDEKVARYATSVMVLFMKQTSSWGDRPKASGHIHSDTLYDFETIENHTGRSATFSFQPLSGSAVASSGTPTATVAPGSANSMSYPVVRRSFGMTPHSASLYRRAPTASARRTTSLGALATSQLPMPQHPGTGHGYPSHTDKIISFTSPIMANTVPSVNALIAKYINKIIFYISASNWPVVFHRIRQKIHFFASGSEDAHDNTDMKLLSYCAMDRSRLIQLFQELSSLLVSMKKEAQSSIALSLRNAIWNWITGFPDQFAETIVSHRRLEGAPERVFDTLYQMMQDPGSLSNNRRIIWPTLAALLATSPERLRQSEAAMAGYGRTPQKLNAFLPTVSSTMHHRDSKQSDIAMVCYLDLCKAAIFLPPSIEASSLRSIAPELADELRSRIMSPPQAFKPFYESADAIDVNLYADILVAIFRFNPTEAMESTFVACLANERSDAVKTCVVRAMVTLVSESKRFEAQPPIEPLYSRFANALREIFLGILRKHELDPSSRQHSKGAAKPVAKKYGTDFYSDSNLLLLTLLTLYRLDVTFYFYGMSDRSEAEVIRDMFVLLSPQQDASIQATVNKMLHTVASSVAAMDTNEDWYENAKRHIYRLGVGTLLASTTGLIMARDSVESLRSHLSLINMVLYDVHLGFLDTTGVYWSQEAAVQFRLALPMACMTILPAAQLDISSQAAKAVRALTFQHVPKPSLPQLFRRQADREKINVIFAQVGDPKIPVLGRVSYHRRLRRLIKTADTSNLAQAVSWGEIYFYWDKINPAFLKAIAASGDGNVNEEQKFEWQTITLFLAATCGGNFLEKSQKPTPFSSLTTWYPPETLPDRFKIPLDFEDLTRKYINVVVDLLVHESLIVRETAKETLGTESQPKMYSMILLQLDSVVTRLFERRLPDWNPANTQILIDQTISVLKLIFDRLESVADASYINVDITHIILQLASFLNAWPSGVATIRIKTKFCGLCHSLFSKADVLAIKKGGIVRNSLLDSIHQWVVAIPNDGNAPDRDGLLKMQAELDLSCIQTAATLLDRLRLQPLDGSIGPEFNLGISRQFSKYLNFFVGALEKAISADVDSLNDRASGHSRPTAGTTKEQGNVKELAITGISNMLSANVDAGLRHCLSMGYHDDPRMRATFVLIFTRVLRQGVRFDSSEAASSQPRRSRLCEMVRNDMLLALAVCETCPVGEIDVMLPVMVNIFDTRSSLLALLKGLIDKEVARYETPTDLFRANSMCTRLLAGVAKVHGYNYLRAILAPLLEEMGRHPPPIERIFNLDGTRLSKGELETNVVAVKTIAQMFLNVVTSSAPILPPLCREICAHIALKVSQRWPESKYSAVGGFLFLRFINPAIVSPETVDLPMDGTFRKGLLMITKIIQNLANNVLFGKEQHMMILNSFLEDNILNITHFLSDVVTLPEYDLDDADEWHGSSYDEADSIVLHRFFHHSADKVGKELLSFSRLAVDEEGNQNGKQTWDNLCSTLVEMGHPVLIPPPNREPMAQHYAYQEFMRSHENRHVDLVRDLFVILPTPLGTNPVYALLLSRVNVESVELDVLIAHIFKTLASNSHPFDLVVDCTGFTASSEIPLMWFKIFLERVPAEFTRRFSRVFFLNSNNAATKFLRKLYHLSGGMSLAKQTYVVSSMEDLKEHIAESAAEGLEYATSLENEKALVYTQVVQQSRHGMRLPIKLYIGETHIRIVSLRSQIIWPGLECHLNEVILLPDIGDVYNVSTGQDINEFIVRRSRYGGTLYFSSMERDVIVHAIRTAKSRMRTDNMPAYERTYTSREISATLLNISLLNLGSEDDALRSTAYDLVCVVATSLNYDDPQIIPVNGGFIPANTSAFASHISERLSSHSPHLTLDVITEFSRGFHKSSSAHKQICLYYLQPWIKNLSNLSDLNGSGSSGGKLRDAIRILIDLLIKDHELAPVIQKTIWSEVAKLESNSISIALEELVRAATDGGIGSRRCEIIADTIVVISSISTRGKILSKLRKAIGKTNLRPGQALTANTAWNEVAAIARLALYAGNNAKIPAHNQLFVPETAHLITLLAGSGPVLMRTTVHGIAVNLIQSLYVSKADDANAAPKLRQLLEEVHTPEVLAMFGLVSNGPIGDYGLVSGTSDILSVDTLENLAKFMLKILIPGAHSSSGSNLINVWRARWMSLVISTAFHSSYIQPRAFVVMGVLGTSDVDDDLLYQILVAFKNALASLADTDPNTVIGILRCITRVVPGTPRNGRYLAQIVWLAIALMEYGDVALFAEAAALLQASLETLEKQEAFNEQPLVPFLFEARVPLEDVMLQIDDYIGLSFEKNFSFTLAAIIFRGMRAPQQNTNNASASLLKTLLRLSAKSAYSTQSTPQSDRAIHAESLGYFLALLPTASTVSALHTILKEAGVGPFWFEAVKSLDVEDGIPRVTCPLLVINDINVALLVATFLGAMLNSATANPEREILFTLLADMSSIYPDTIAQIYESIQERVIEAFSNVTNPAILSAVGAIFRTSILEVQWQNLSTSRLNGSASTIGTVDPTAQGAGRVQLALLEEMQMRGLLSPHHFLPRSAGMRLLHCMVDLVSRIIE